MIFTFPGQYCGHGAPNAVDIRFINVTDPGNLDVSGDMDFKLMARFFELLADMTNRKAAC
jgi:hypothetical protein